MRRDLRSGLALFADFSMTFAWALVWGLAVGVAAGTIALLLP